VTWRVFLTDSSQPDLDAFTPADRAAITDELFAWVPDGPPRTRGQVVAGVQLFGDQLPIGDQRHLLRRRAGSLRRRRPYSEALIPAAGVSHNRTLPGAVKGAHDAGSVTPAVMADRSALQHALVDGRPHASGLPGVRLKHRYREPRETPNIRWISVGGR